MTLSDGEQAVLAGVAEIEDSDGDDDRGSLQVLVANLYQEVYEGTGEEQPDLDDEARAILESLVQMGLVEHRPPTKPDPELTDAGRLVHEKGPEAVDFDVGDSDDGARSEPGGLLSKVTRLFS